MSLLSTADVAQRLGCTPSSVVSLAQRGELTGSFFLRSWKFSESAVQEFIAASVRSR